MVADYLEVRRSAILKSKPVKNGAEVERPIIGSKMELLNNGKQTNGYYQSIGPSTRKTGWIYRTLVRRHSGNLPGRAPSVSVPLPDTPTALLGPLMRAHYIFVGQGDATLLEFSCGAILIDAGGKDSATDKLLVNYLKAFFKRRPDLKSTLDTIFATHTHVDHNRALEEIVTNFKVKNYVHNGVFEGSGRHKAKWMRDKANQGSRQINLRTVQQPEITPLPRNSGLVGSTIDAVNCTGTNPRVQVLASTRVERPDNWTSSDFKNGNNKSLVIRVDFGNASFLFTGDLEDAGIDSLIRRYDGTKMLDVDVYQVGHHGANNGTTSDLVEVMSPNIAIFSMGKYTRQKPHTAWSYGHPRKAIVEMLDKEIDRGRKQSRWVKTATGMRTFVDYNMKDAIYGTGWGGNIVVAANSNGLYSVVSGAAAGGM